MAQYWKALISVTQRLWYIQIFWTIAQIRPTTQPSTCYSQMDLETTRETQQETKNGIGPEAGNPEWKEWVVEDIRERDLASAESRKQMIMIRSHLRWCSSGTGCNGPRRGLRLLNSYMSHLGAQDFDSPPCYTRWSRDRQPAARHIASTALQIYACQWPDSDVIVTMRPSILVCSISPSPDSPQWNTCCASLGLSVTLWLPTCASQWDSVYSGHTTFGPRSLKHGWDCKAIHVFDWPISVHWKWKRYCFGASNDETCPSHGHRDRTATKPGSSTSPWARRLCAFTGNRSRAYRRHSGIMLAPPIARHHSCRKCTKVGPEPRHICEWTALRIQKERASSRQKMSARCFRPTLNCPSRLCRHRCLTSRLMSVWLLAPLWE